MTTNTVKHTPGTREWQPIEAETKFKACLVEGCDGNAHFSAHGGKGWCISHYERWRLHGDPMGGGVHRNAARRFLLDAIVFRGDECLVWPYTKGAKGYGITWVDGKTRKVHRYVCGEVHGPAPEGKPHAAHYCGNASCINPIHLRWASPLENAADKVIHGTATPRTNSNQGRSNGTPLPVETTTEKQAACSDRPTNSQDTPHQPANAGEDDPIQASPAPISVSLHISSHAAEPAGGGYSSPVASTPHASQGNSEHGADIAAGSLTSSSHDRLEVVSA